MHRVGWRTGRVGVSKKSKMVKNFFKNKARGQTFIYLKSP